MGVFTFYNSSIELSLSWNFWKTHSNNMTTAADSVSIFTGLCVNVILKHGQLIKMTEADKNPYT